MSQLPLPISMPAATEYAPFYAGYVQQIKAQNPHQALLASLPLLQASLQAIPPAKATYAYAPQKWTLAQLLQHMIDTERVFAFRALWIARGDTQPLPGFDENEWATQAMASHRNWHDLVSEMISCRQLSIQLFNSFLPHQWLHTGIASGNPVSVRALACIIMGHALHHLHIIEQRYLP